MNNKLLQDSPNIVGDWITFTTTDYATRERRTHATVRVSHISSIDENYDLDQYGNRNWCTIHMSNGKSYQVLASYSDLCKMLAKDNVMI
jgi:hypothetical protein